jgi:hypothetical protein
MALEWCNPKSDLWRLNVRCSSCFIKDDELVVDFIIDHVMPNGEQKRWKGSLDETLDRVCALLRVDKPVKTWHVRATIPRSAGETTESECIGTEEDAKLELWNLLDALGVETAAVPEEDT